MNEQLSPDEAFAAGRLLSDGPPGAEALLVLGDAAGMIVHVSEVPRGASCGCLCHACRAPLIARHGEVRVWHFAHQSRARCDPTGAITAAMRSFAQQVLQAGHGLRLPDLSVSVGTEKKAVVRDRVLQPDSVRIEERDGVTELILTQGGRELLVELATRRSLSRKRQAAICDAERAAIEIDLTAVVQERDAAVIREAILKAAPRRWIFNLRERQARLELEREMVEQVRHRLSAQRRGEWELPSRARAPVARPGEVFSYYVPRPSPTQRSAVSPEAWAAALRAAASTPHGAPNESGSRPDDPLPRLREAGLRDLVGLSVPGLRAFAVEPEHWQSCVLLGLVNAAEATDIKAEEMCLNWIEIRDLLRLTYRQFEEAGAPLIDSVLQQLQPEAWPARRAIDAYLSLLAAKGFVLRSVTGFRASKVLVDRLAGRPR